MDFRQIRRGQRNLARLHLLQGRERGGGRRGDLRPRHPLPQLLNQRLVVGGAVQERGAGSAEQQHVDGGRAGQARGLLMRAVWVETPGPDMAHISSSITTLEAM
ncbi:hypothetical protein G6F35_017612 [Rhizopus arrhizus]|nr:hypothetical protein G6F35_017612 [Rhizopus arrhizus]